MKFLVTAGPTREPLDPVRFISNPSTGKMGYALAEEVMRRGHEVILVSGPTWLAAPKAAAVVSVVSAREMHDAVVNQFGSVDVLLMAAAVSDYRPRARSRQKIKKDDQLIAVELERTPDILEEVGRIKGSKIIVGFAAETEQVVEHALVKLKKKNLDFIVINDITAEGSGFESDTNKVEILHADGTLEKFPLLRKQEVASIILDRVMSLLKTNRGVERIS